MEGSTDATGGVVARAVCAGIMNFKGSVMHELLAIRNELCIPGRAPPARIAMLYSTGWFVLWTEGDDGAVDRVLRAAAADPRVEHTTVLHRSLGAAQLHERIAVSTTQVPLSHARYGRIVERLTERGQALEPVDVFRVLAAPCLIAPAGDLDTRPTRHVALVSAQDNGPMEQLRRLGEQVRTPVVYRRFAGAKRHTSDVGIAYVDVPLTEGIGRIHLLSRRALDQPIVRHSLHRLEGVGVVLGTHVGAAAGVARTLSDCLHRAQPQPAVYLFGGIRDHARACARMFTDAGMGRVRQVPPGAATHDPRSLLAAFGWLPQRTLPRVGAPAEESPVSVR
jgi:hypothetical protein